MQNKDNDEKNSTKIRLENRFADFVEERTCFLGDTYLENSNPIDIDNPNDEAIVIAAYKRGFIDAILLFIK